MSESVNQFIQIIRETWRELLFCETCGGETIHAGREDGEWERYTCYLCKTEKSYRVK